MADYRPPDDSPLLTTSQWKAYDEAAEDELSDSDRWSHRSRARARIRDSITAFQDVLQHIPPDDRRKVFEDLKAFRHYRAEEIEALLEMDDSGGGGGLHGRAPEIEKSDSARRGQNLRRGIVALLAFLYDGIDDRLEFERMIEEGVAEARRNQGLLQASIEVEIGDRGLEHKRDELIELYRSGEISRRDLQVLHDLDPVAIFEAELLDDEDE